MALEAIFDDTSIDQVKAELDIYWLTKAGEKPVEWFNRYKNRTPLIHLKDMTTDEEQFLQNLEQVALILKQYLIPEKKRV